MNRKVPIFRRNGFPMDIRSRPVFESACLSENRRSQWSVQEKIGAGKKPPDNGGKVFNNDIAYQPFNL